MQQPRKTAQSSAVSGRSRAQAVKKKKKKKVRFRNKNLKYQILTLIAVVLAVVLCLVVFFRVNHIRVLNGGNQLQTEQEDNTEPGVTHTYYTAQEIEKASGITIGDNLLTISKEAVAAKIMAELPYVSEVTVRRVLPGTVDITVREFEVAYAIADTAGGWWLINRNGVVLEQTDETQAGEHLTVKGLLAESPQVAGEIVPQTLEDMTEQEAKKTSLIRILQLVEEYGYCKELVSIDLTSSYDIRFWYGTQFEIRIGNTEDISYKLAYLDGVLRELESYQSGVIDLAFAEDKNARFQPFSD